MSYLIGTRHGFGTGLVERWRGAIPDNGMSGYVPTPNFFSTPAGVMGIRGMGCGCHGVGCTCDGGLGQTGVFGTSLFESSNPADWGWGEYATILVGGYVILSVFDTTRRGTRAVRRKSKAMRRAIAA